MTIDPRIDLGQILTITSLFVVVIGAHFSLKARVDGLEKSLIDFGRRLAKNEEVLITLVGQVQRVIGALEARRHGGEE